MLLALRNQLKRPLTLVFVSLVVLITGVVAADYFTGLPKSAVATYVGRDACVECHQTESLAFKGSHHDLAMDVATDESVIGDFNDVVFEHDGLQNRLFRDGDRFMVHTEGPDGKMQDFEVKYVFGVDPLQQYMVEFDRDPESSDDEIGRLQVLRISWDTHRKEWFYLRPPDVPEKLEPNDPLHWTGVAQRWQTMCADCHSTNLKTNHDVETLTYHTTFSEIDVSCEACHGPASLHIEMARGNSLFWDRHHGYGLAQLKGEDATGQLEACAPCHSRRSLMDADYQAGDPFCSHFNLELLRGDTYHDDGQIKDEVYVYGSFVQSKMFHKGIRCTDCHDPHSLELKHPGNETCTSCHQHAAGKYDVPSHHHHAVGSEGAKCVNCHMPHTTYMEVDPRRDHSLRVPRPDLSVSIGTPNACSSCHVKDQLENISADKRESLDLYQDWLLAASEGDEEVAEAISKTDQWCDEACDRWYGDDRQTPAHYGEILHGLRSGDSGSIAKALRYVMEPPEIAPVLARATTLDELLQSGRGRESISAAKAVLKDSNEHPILRATAARVMGASGPSDAVKTLLPLLTDPSRLVRSEATKALVSSGGYQTLSGTRQKQADLAIDAIEDELMLASDRAGAHMAWASLSEQRGDYLEAAEAYQNAIRVQPSMSGPRTNYASMLDQLVSAAAQSREAQSAIVQLFGGSGALNELMIQASEKAAQLRRDELPLLGRDAKLASKNADVQYRYGLALYLSGDLPAAEKQLQRAAELAPDVEIFSTALQLLRERINQSEK
ncbi:HEAT repeat domain-containing protein [Rhodopirellula europaea]|uniref:Tetratricopeptide repeat family protein n=1 Tax=Rhodopirellula europaea 6C TaxID=1263867 RepID=M2AYB1_9BACT|nr:HEAT repeat domain-containing protein [Rhodopirellula europaea]EMB14969.1 tetratricopeptide repeat family protein [Rhodopirellula europaea 6C]